MEVLRRSFAEIAEQGLTDSSGNMRCASIKMYVVVLLDVSMHFAANNYQAHIFSNLSLVGSTSSSYMFSSGTCIESSLNEWFVECMSACVQNRGEGGVSVLSKGGVRSRGLQEPG